jgi:hypothetical protein
MHTSPWPQHPLTHAEPAEQSLELVQVVPQVTFDAQKLEPSAVRPQ